MTQISKPRTVRWILAVSALTSLLMLVYASIVPLEYAPMDREVAWTRFKNIPWLNLSIERRADWVANALVVIPSGFLVMGAIDWGRKSRLRAFLMLPVVVIALSAIVVGIEFLQHWFPRRTISQNDIAAGMIGAGLGSLLWLLVGRLVGRSIEQFMALPSGGPRICWLVVAYGIGLLVYSALPFDMILSASEWQEKYQAGRLTAVPLSDLTWSLKSLLSVALVVVRMIPIGFAARLSFSTRNAYWLIGAVATLLELVQVPVFSRFASTTDVMFGMLGGAIGCWLVAFIPWLLRLAKLQSVWVLVAGGWSVLIIVAFVGKFDRLATTAEVRERFFGLWTPPFVRYYFTSEFSAGANLLGKMIVFAVLGFLLNAGIQAPGKCRMRWLCWILASLWVIVLGSMVELLQVFLLPFIADANDVLTYIVGAMAGATLYPLLFQNRRELR